METWVLLPTGSEERGLLGVGSFPVATFTSLLSRYENYYITTLLKQHTCK